MKKFDLNIEDILDNWEIYHAIREILANALDEQKISDTKDVNIYKDPESVWHIRDYGRGLQKKHLTQNEDEEKLARNDVIGKFGIGLKDSMAVFYRKGVEVEIQSKHHSFSIGMSEKSGFEDIITLHVYVSKPEDPTMKGTDVRLKGIGDEDIERAKNLFLEYSNEKVLENTKYGQIIERKEYEPAKIYVNGLQISSEENFLFSYNVTNLTKKIRKELNRERNNLGRSVYGYRIRKILQKAESSQVLDRVCEDFIRRETGEQHEETNYKEIQKLAVQHLNAKGDVVFLTQDEMEDGADTIDEIKNHEHRRIIHVPSSLSEDLSQMQDTEGNDIWTGRRFVQEVNKDFSYDFVEPENFSTKEKKIYSHTNAIVKLLGDLPSDVKEIKISNTMKKSNFGVSPLGTWNKKDGIIVVKRDQLNKLESYAGTLIHELTHAKTKKDDVTRDFEIELTNSIGKLAGVALKHGKGLEL